MMRTLLILLVLVHGAVAAEKYSVLLTGHDEPIVGYLRQVSESRYFLQSDGLQGCVTYDIPRSSIASVDGQESIPEGVQGTSRLIDYSTLEIIRPDGDVEVWSNTVVKTKLGPVTEVTFNAKPEELPRYREMEAFDQYGNRLDVNIAPGRDDLFQITIPLAVPAGHKEDVVLTLKTVRHQAAVLEDGVWTYTRNTQFPEDRLYVRKVRLPSGATFISASHYARPWRDVEPQTIYWRRYCPARTDDLMTVTYRLP